MANQIVDNRKVRDGIIALPGFNTRTWYTRETPTSFSINGSFNGADNIFDWVLIKTMDTRYAKSNVIKVASAKKSLVVRFATAFPSTDYFVFFSSADDVNLYTVEKFNNRFVINSSFEIGNEITWFAIHKTLVTSSGFNTSGSLFAGTRAIGGPLTLNLDEDDNVIETIPIENNAYANLSGWYNDEYLIKPSTALDGFQHLPDLSSYSIILSSNTNINTYWIEKATDRVKIGTSYPTPCSIDYLMVKTGVDWWNLF
jgi:hypothetical protein